MDKNTKNINSILVDYKSQLLKEVSEKLENEKKSKSRKESLLFIICAITLLYTLPLENVTTQTDITIPAISMKIPIKTAINFFPTLISILHLMIVTSNIKLIELKFKRSRLLTEIREEIEGPTEDRRGTYRKAYLRQFFLPSQINPQVFTVSKFGEFCIAFVNYFVAVVYTIFPISVIVFVIFKTYSLSHQWYILIWNCLCLTAIIIGMIGTLSGIKAGDKRGAVERVNNSLQKSKKNNK